ncbi:MAG TPA: exodeoxyribonuclease VII small subunit [bacterium]|nr:exodeoxyribonuclease VII small subunit [bacterium]
MTAKQQTFESAFKRLQELVAALENGESTLEESLKAFEEGVSLIRFCSDVLDRAQARVDKLVEDDHGGFRLEPME